MYELLFDNIIFSLQKHGGISSYWYELLSRIEASNYIDYCNANILRKELEIEPNKIIKNKYNPKLYLFLQEKIRKGNVFHSSYYRTSKYHKNILTVHDFAHEKMFKGIYRNANINLKKRAIENADHIICISNSTKEDLLELYPKLVKEISVIYNGVSTDYFKSEIDKNSSFASRLLKKSNGKKILLYIGSRAGYKNFGLLYECLSNDYYLVIVGGGELTKKETINLNKKLYNSYLFIPYVTNSELNILYNLAFALLYPSLYEGFGIPLIESMKAGCPVICNKNSSLIEIGGEAAIFMKRNDYRSLLNAINEIENNSFREDKIQCGIDISKKFNWDKAADETKKIYERFEV